MVDDKTFIVDALLNPDELGIDTRRLQAFHPLAVLPLAQNDADVDLGRSVPGLGVSDLRIFAQGWVRP
jgi:hypothetical protein